MFHPCFARVPGWTSTSFTSVNRHQTVHQYNGNEGKGTAWLKVMGKPSSKWPQPAMTSGELRAAGNGLIRGVIVLCPKTNDQHKLQQYDTACNWYSLEVNYLKQSQTVSVSEHARIRHDLPNPCTLPKQSICSPSVSLHPQGHTAASSAPHHCAALAQGYEVHKCRCGGPGVATDMPRKSE